MIRHPVVSRPTVDFTAALAAAGSSLTPPFHGSAIASLPGLPPWGGRRYVIRALSYTAVERVGLGFDFYSSASGGFLGRFLFASADLAQLDGAGPYTAYIDGLEIPYADLDTLSSQNPPTLHLAVQNADTTAKSAGGAGAITVTAWVEALSTPAGIG